MADLLAAIGPKQLTYEGQHENTDHTWLVVRTGGHGDRHEFIMLVMPIIVQCFTSIHKIILK